MQFENTLERASLLARVDKNNIVKFDVKENNILITSNSEIASFCRLPSMNFLLFPQRNFKKGYTNSEIYVTIYNHEHFFGVCGRVPLAVRH